MSASEPIEWQRCRFRDGCRGARLEPYGRCLAHLRADELKGLAEAIAETGLDARGVVVSRALIQELRQALGRDGHPIKVPDGRFDGAVFDSLGFDGFAFARRASFVRTRFEGDIVFTNVTFAGPVSFLDATFVAGASFDRATFEDRCSFRAAVFPSAGSQRDALFRRARFHGAADFVDAVFERAALFDGAEFSSEATFDRARFGRASFSDARFMARASFDPEPAGHLTPTFATQASFQGARFEQPVSFRRDTFAATCSVYLDDASFKGPVAIQGSLGGLWCRETAFGDRLLCRVHGAETAAELIFEGASFARPSLIAGAEPLGADRAAPRPRLLSLERAAVENLALSRLDLRDCDFTGAYGLDRLRFEGDTELATTPAGWSWRQRWPLRRAWTRREVIAEERRWRHDRERRGRGDTAADGEHTSWFPDGRPMGRWQEWSSPEAGEIATIYRALRKGREDSKDEPGAADLYYGEMEMRRHASHKPGGGQTPRAERAILWIYWLMSGYGLRASRALLAFAFTVILFAMLFDQWGFDAQQDFGRALLISFQSTTSLVISPTNRDDLNDTGELFLAVLRLLGPLLLGLAILSVRGRVKR